MDFNQLQEELVKLRAENDALKSKKTPSFSMKVTEKGGVSVYGLGRFPVTLYESQWTKLLGQSDAIRQFIADNIERLTTKN